jgi:hypothetical protein
MLPYGHRLIGKFILKRSIGANYLHFRTKEMELLTEVVSLNSRPKYEYILQCDGGLSNFSLVRAYLD